MAYIGLVKATVAKLDESNGEPTYTDGFSCGKAVELSITPQYAEGSLFGDDEKAEYDKEFSYAEISLRTTTLPINAHTTMFGHTVTDSDKNVIKDSISDEANYVGVGVYIPEKVGGVKKFVGMWICKAKFTESEENYKTKGDTVEYQTPSLSGQAVGLNSGVWRERHIFATEKEAQDWIDTKAGIKQLEPEGGA